MTVYVSKRKNVIRACDSISKDIVPAEDLKVMGVQKKYRKRHTQRHIKQHILKTYMRGRAILSVGAGQRDR